jgi:hypothetical protein
MRVNIQDCDNDCAEPVTTFVGADLLECFPEAAEYAEALVELERTGVYTGGGGAAPAFRLTVAS